MDDTSRHRVYGVRRIVAGFTDVLELRDFRCPQLESAPLAGIERHPERPSGLRLESTRPRLRPADHSPDQD